MGIGLLLSLAACNFGLDVNHDINLGIDDDCLTCLPDCTGETYTCVDGAGAECAGCEVGCLAGRTLMCVEDGPACEQDLYGEVERVPVICVSR